MARRASVSPKLNQGHATLLPIPSIPFWRLRKRWPAPMVVIIIRCHARRLRHDYEYFYLAASCFSPSPPSTWRSSWCPYSGPISSLRLLRVARPTSPGQFLIDEQHSILRPRLVCWQRTRPLDAGNNWLLSSQLGSQNALANAVMAPGPLTGGTWPPIPATPDSPWAY